MEQLMQTLSLYLADNSLFALPAVYLGGVIVSFTPCVYPVAPLTVAFIGAHGAGSRWKGFRLSLFYVLGMALTYTVLGGIAAFTGQFFGKVQSNPWSYFLLANVFIIMGLFILGALSIPVRTPEIIVRLQHREKTNSVLGSFAVGLLSGLVIGPCTAPVLAVLLSYVATRQSALFGMSLLFFFSLGMGTLLILLGTFAGLLASLPRSGFWLVRIRRLSGWLLLAMGEYLLIKAGMLWF